MSYSAVGKVWDPTSFRAFVAKNKESIKAWARGVTVHHTGSPSLAQRPKGWTLQHMRNLEHFFQHELRWSAGPHFFTDEDEIFGLSPVSARGVHAVSFNSRYLSVEALGDYDNEDPLSGRGLEVWETTATLVGILLDELGWDESAINFHRDDPQTSKSCPGTKVTRSWFLGLVRKTRAQTPEPQSPDDMNALSRLENASQHDKLLGEVKTRLGHIEWQLAAIRQLLHETD